jgi:hypothetical protein
MKSFTVAHTALALWLLSLQQVVLAANGDGIHYKGIIKVTNKMPVNGTCQTPVWVGIHDGTFDTYDRDQPISAAMERLAEDGNTVPITADFANADGTVWDATVGAAPFCSGETVELSFEIVIKPGAAYYFSYASMVLPSNDAFLSNGDPMAHMIFNSTGGFVDVEIESVGADVLDAGTEVNDEIPENTAFFGQMVPDTGIVEGGVVATHPGFMPAGNEGILDDPRFVDADFTAEGYQMMSITVVLEEDDSTTDDYAFIVSMIDEETPWCLTATESRPNGNLGFRPCDFDGTPDNQMWKMDVQGRFHSKVDPEERCMVVGFGAELFDGVRMRLGMCNAPQLNKFGIDETDSQYFQVLGEDGERFCITNRGGNAHPSDTIHAKPCPDEILSDYQWEYYYYEADP